MLDKEQPRVVAPADAALVEPEDVAAPPPPSEPGRHPVTITETRQIIPGPGLPAEIVPGNSNNNLDVARLGGRVYLAWRTAPDHFASTRTQIFVVSSTDERTWRFEQRLVVAWASCPPGVAALACDTVAP